MDAQFQLTPAGEGENDNILGGNVDKDYYHFLKHKQSLSSHPHHSHQCEVVDRDGYEDTATIEYVCCLLADSHKHKSHYQHEEESKRELNMVLGDILLSYFPAHNAQS